MVNGKEQGGSMYYILSDVHGKGHTPVPVKDPIAWARWWAANGEERRVGQTVVGNASVSTVFLGIDHAFGGGTPQLFETMIFGGKHDEYEERCATWEEAEAMHERAVTMLSEERRSGGSAFRRMPRKRKS
jgi:hypothetical protein